MNVSDLAGLAESVNFNIGGWEEFGYADPPMPDAAAVPPLGERSANAIKAGHEAIKVIDQLTARLHQVREQLVGELRQDSDIRMARPLPRTPAAEVLDTLRASGWTDEDLDAVPRLRELKTEASPDVADTLAAHSVTHPGEAADSGGNGPGLHA